MTRWLRSPLTLALVALSTFALSTAVAQEGTVEEARAWSDTADVSVIVTTGNSKNTNFSFNNKFIYKWTKSDFTVDASALRTETKDRILSNPTGNEVEESEESRTTAETYTFGAKYRYTIHEGLFWYAAAGWLRNRPAGIERRTNGGAGIGYRFIKTDADTLVGEIGVDYTRERSIDDEKGGFGGVRGFLGYEHIISPTAKFTSELELLDNLETTTDWRAKWVTALTASLTKKLALKVSETVLYDNDPVVVQVPLDGATVPPIPTAEFEFDETDTIFAAALVINF